MATLSVPPVLSSPRDDAMQLFRAFKGTNLLVCVNDIFFWLLC